MTNSAKKEEIFSDDDSDEDTDCDESQSTESHTLRKFETFLKDFKKVSKSSSQF